MESIYKSFLEPELYIPRIRGIEVNPISMPIPDYRSGFDWENRYFDATILPTYDLLTFFPGPFRTYGELIQVSGGMYPNFETLDLSDYQSQYLLGQARIEATPGLINAYAEFNLLNDERFRSGAIDQLLRLTEKYQDATLQLTQLTSKIFRRKVTIKSMDALCRRIFRSLKKRAYKNDSIYCGMNWTDRIWFLLHGSHPPKSTYSPNGFVLAGGACI